MKQSINLKLFLFNCVWGVLYMSADGCGCRKRTLDPLELEFQVVLKPRFAGAGNCVGSSARAVQALHP